MTGGKPQQQKPAPTTPREQQSIHTQPGDFCCPHDYWRGPGFWQCYYCGHAEPTE